MSIFIQTTQNWYCVKNSSITDYVAVYCRVLQTSGVSHFVLTHASPVIHVFDDSVISISAPCCLNKLVPPPCVSSASCPIRLMCTFLLGLSSQDTGPHGVSTESQPTLIQSLVSGLWLPTCPSTALPSQSLLPVVPVVILARGPGIFVCLLAL